MNLPQAVLAVIVGNAFTAGVLYCVWLSKHDPHSRKGFWLAILLAVIAIFTGYAARS